MTTYKKDQPLSLNEKDLFVDISDSDFDFYKNLIEELAGISLKETKKSLVTSRLRAHVFKLGFKSFSEYRNFLETLSSEDPEFQNFINLLTTNKTDFFREPKHFEYLIDKYIPEFLDQGKTDLKIWCCATSTGEEPYTLSMILNDVLKDKANFSILATDIDTKVLSAAENGVYSIAKLHEIPDKYHKKSILLGSQSVGDWFKVKDSIKEPIHFSQFNLITDDMPDANKFDIIFCRNVLIYFSAETIKKIMIKLHRHLKKDGLLFISHTENIPQSMDIFKSLKSSIYIKLK